MFHRLPDGSIVRTGRCRAEQTGLEGYQGGEPIDDKTRTTGDINLADQTVTVPNLNDRDKTKNPTQAPAPAVSAWKSGPPPGIIPSGADSTFPEDHMETSVVGIGAEAVGSNEVPVGTISPFVSATGENSWAAPVQVSHFFARAIYPSLLLLNKLSVIS